MITAVQVLATAVLIGVPAFRPSMVLDTKVLLGSLGLDLADPGVREELLDLLREGELVLVRVDLEADAQRSLAERGHDPALLDASAIVDRGSKFHAILIRAETRAHAALLRRLEADAPPAARSEAP
ncbi:MAG TPA: hypothetical protein VN253_24895 [Kofleriaceae bacterium]|nr:hypothetical protein [Kofleriaceae bacterium]